MGSGATEPVPSLAVLREFAEGWQDRARTAEAELERLRTWDGLMSLLDEHWPVDVFRADPLEDDADPGPRVVALLRWVQQLRDRVAKLEDRDRISSILSPYYGALTNSAIEDITAKLLGEAP